MSRKLLIWVIMVSSIGLLAVDCVRQGAAASEQKQVESDSVKDLHARIVKLEAQVAALQAQVKELTLKSSSRVLALPGTHIFPENKIPRGATQHEINGLKYWIIPIKEGQ